MKKYKLILTACLTGVLLSFAWPEKGFSPLLLIAFIPLLWVENYIYNDTSKRFSSFSGIYYSYLPFLIWNVLTTYWVWNSTPVAVVAFTVNALLMAITFQLFFYTRKKFLKGNLGYFCFPVYWIAFEFFHMNWDLSWPWLTIGNGFATMPQLVQWYQITGVLGGTLWVLIVNILLFLALQSFVKPTTKKIPFIYLIIVFLFIGIPSGISIFMYNSFKEPWTAIPCDVVAVQPNVDPYNEQYDLPPSAITERLLLLASQKTDSNTEFIVAPESCLQDGIWEEDIEYAESINTIEKFISHYPKLAFVTGLSSRIIVPQGKKYDAMREFKNNPGNFYVLYNTAVLIDGSKQYQILHKSKLTPGVEIMPYIKYIPFLDKLAINLGGSIGSLGREKKRVVFTSPSPNTKIATIICYESVYGDYVSRYIRKGAELIFIITNDGWWKDTPGHRQHLQYARLRAIEFRKWIARSANTGISAFVSPKGEILHQTHYWEQNVIKQTLYRNNIITFYARYGDYIGQICLVCGGILFFTTIITSRLRKRNTKNLKK